MTGGSCRPPAAWRRLLDVSFLIEATDSLPKPLIHWRLTLLPKEKGDRSNRCLQSDTGSHRPLWTSCRFQQLGNRLRAVLPALQAGALPGADCERFVPSLLSVRKRSSRRGFLLTSARSFDSKGIGT